MLFLALVLGTISFAQTKAMIVQIELDKAGFSCNTIDGVWGSKSTRAETHYAHAHDLPVQDTPETVYAEQFKDRGSPYRWETVTSNDISALVHIPDEPAAKAELNQLGYETIKEMFAERGHLSQRALERLNPQLDWNSIAVGDRIRIPDFPSLHDDLAAWPRNPSDEPARPVATLLRVSLGRFEITAHAPDGTCLAAFPCSIAKNKANLPPHGELKVVCTIPYPNYTYSPDYTPPGKKARRHILPPGPNCPVGVAWIGLNLPGYGIHGTPNPETIGNAESHGCFRLSNWNAARLYALVKPGTRVLIEP